MKIPEAIAVYLPSPSTARLKIPPHMIDVQSPQSAKNMIPTGTVSIPKPMLAPPLNTGIATVVALGANIPISKKIKASEETTVN